MEPRNRSAVVNRNEALAEGKKSEESRHEREMSARYGLAAARLVLSTESKHQFEELEKAYYARFQPANGVEADLVDDMVAARWRLRRDARNRQAYGAGYETTLYRNIDNAVAELRCMQKDRLAHVEAVTFENMRFYETKVTRPLTIDNNTYK
jgi:hypothetical protein